MGPITPEDHDAGFKDLPLEYRRSPTPAGSPDSIRIRALSYVEAAAIHSALHGEAKPEAKFNDHVWRLSVLLAALPDPHNSVEFVNRLKPACADRLMIAALHLAYGAPDSLPPANDGKKKRIASESSVPA